MHCGTTWMCTPVQGCNAFSAPRSWDFDDRCGGMYSRACFTAGKCEKVRITRSAESFLTSTTCYSWTSFEVL